RAARRRRRWRVSACAAWTRGMRAGAWASGWGVEACRRGGRRRNGCARLLYDARPVLAAAQDAEHASLNLEYVGIEQADVRRIRAAVLRVVDVAVPLVLLRLRHAEEHRHSQRRPAALSGVGVLAVDARMLFPCDHAPQTVVAIDDSDARVAFGCEPFAERIGRGAAGRLSRRGSDSDEQRDAEGANL